MIAQASRFSKCFKQKVCCVRGFEKPPPPEEAECNIRREGETEEEQGVFEFEEATAFAYIPPATNPIELAWYVKKLLQKEMEQFDRRERSPKGEALRPVSVAIAQETDV